MINTVFGGVITLCRHNACIAINCIEYVMIHDLAHRGRELLAFVHYIEKGTSVRKSV